MSVTRDSRATATALLSVTGGERISFGTTEGVDGVRIVRGEASYRVFAAGGSINIVFNRKNTFAGMVNVNAQSQMPANREDGELAEIIRLACSMTFGL